MTENICPGSEKLGKKHNLVTMDTSDVLFCFTPDCDFMLRDAKNNEFWKPKKKDIKLIRQ